MGDVAQYSTWNEEWFYKEFGIDAEIIIDHAWGIEPVTMKDIKSYHTDSHSLSNGQVLPKPYRYPEARNVFLEMVDSLCGDMFSQNLISKRFSWYTGYDYKSLEMFPEYDGDISIDFYGRPHPKHSKGTVRLRNTTNLLKEVQPFIMSSFDEKANHSLLFRRLGISRAARSYSRSSIRRSQLSLCRRLLRALPAPESLWRRRFSCSFLR